MGTVGREAFWLVLNDYSPSQHNYQENKGFSKIFFFFKFFFKFGSHQRKKLSKSFFHKKLTEVNQYEISDH